MPCCVFINIFPSGAAVSLLSSLCMSTLMIWRWFWVSFVNAQVQSFFYLHSLASFCFNITQNLNQVFRCYRCCFFVCFFALVLCEIEIQYAVLSSPWLHALKSALNCSIYTAIFIIAHSRNLSMTMMKLYIKEYHFDERKYFLNNVNDVKDASHNL